MTTTDHPTSPSAADAAIELPALDGRVPLGFLAALGTLRLLSEHDDPDARLAWSPSTFTARLHTTTAQDREGIADALQRTAEGMGDTRVPGMPSDFPPPQAAPDQLRSSPQEIASLLAGWQTQVDPGRAADWARAVVTDLARDTSRPNEVAITPFAAPSGRQSFGTMFTKAKELTQNRPGALEEALAGWRRVDDYSGEYLDHNVLRDAADSLTGKSVERGIPGATWLALMALPMLPVTGDIAGRRRGTGWQNQGRQPIMRWPLWHATLDIHAIRSLIDHPALTLTDDGALTTPNNDRLNRLHVFAIGTATRMRIPGRKSEGVLTPLKTIAVTNRAS